jgi:hypothetical protein
MDRGMRWKFIQASVAGTSHSENGRGCEDECLAEILSAPDGEEIFVGLIADGAGSAKRGGTGARIACESGIADIEGWIKGAGSFSGINPAVVTDWVGGMLNKINETADSESLTPRDYACTLLGSVIGTESSVFFQVGDGCIVINDGSGFVPMFWPDSGEYANMSYFITDEDAMSHLRIRVCPSALDELAIFSDGLQRLALVYESKSAYNPFFQPMFSVLRKTAPDGLDSLSNQLAKFLNSPKVNERTDDDKSLILATRRPAE